MRPRFLRLNAPVAIALALVAHALFVTGEQPAEAVPTSYTNVSTGSTPSVRRAGWAGDTRVSTFSLEGFQAAQFAGGPPFGVEGIVGTITSTAAAGGGSFTPPPTNVFNVGAVMAGFTMTNVGSAGADDFFAINNGVAPLLSGMTVGVSTGGIGVASESDTLTISFPASRNVTAVGFDVFTWVTAGTTPVSRTVTVQAFGASGAIFSTAPTIVSSTAGWVFIGLVVDEAITSVTVNGDPGILTSVETIDNLVFNPEPSTFALTALGLLGLAGVVRRRRRARPSA